MSEQVLKHHKDLVDLLTGDYLEEGCSAYIKPVSAPCGVDMGEGVFFCEDCQLRFQAAEEIERLKGENDDLAVLVQEYEGAMHAIGREDIIDEARAVLLK